MRKNKNKNSINSTMTINTAFISIFTIIKEIFQYIQNIHDNLVYFQQDSC